jgi:hypothetical protein
MAFIRFVAVRQTRWKSTLLCREPAVLPFFLPVLSKSSLPGTVYRAGSPSNWTGERFNAMMQFTSTSGMSCTLHLFVGRVYEVSDRKIRGWHCLVSTKPHFPSVADFGPGLRRKTLVRDQVLTSLSDADKPPLPFYLSPIWTVDDLIGSSPIVQAGFVEIPGYARSIMSFHWLGRLRMAGNRMLELFNSLSTTRGLGAGLSKPLLFVSRRLSHLSFFNYLCI